MTRVEAYEIGEEIKVPSVQQRSLRIKEFVDKIYDSFEALQDDKSCETCKHLTDDGNCSIGYYEITCKWNYALDDLYEPKAHE